MTVEAADVRAFVLGRVTPRLDALGLRPADVSDDFDLLAEDALDSFGLLELIGELERMYGCELSFDDVDADELVAIGPFSRLVASQVDGLPTAASLQTPPDPAESAGGRVFANPTPPTVGRGGAPTRTLGRAAVRAHTLVSRTFDKLFSLSVRGGFAGFGSHSVIQRPVRLKNPQRIVLGSDAFIGAGSWLQVLEEGLEPAIVVGDGASFAGYTVLSACESIRIGQGVSMARNVYIADHSHEYDDPTRAVVDHGVTNVRPVVIGDGCWLGENVVILPGVTVGERAVIGANSVVRDDVPAHSLALGVPARVVRRFDR